MSEKNKLAGAVRTTNLIQKVTKGMQKIQADMQANGGIYPHNGGAVNMRELVRRSEINESSIYNKEREANIALKKRADLWLDTLKKTETVGRERVKQTLAQRVKEWRRKHEALEQRHICTELELQASKAEWEKERKELTGNYAILERESAVLRDELRKANASRVTPFPKGKH